MDKDPYRYFRVEARELLDQLGRGVLDLERSAPPELVAKLLRLAHTLKGAARVVKQREIADLAHRVEDELSPLRESGGAVSRDRIDTVLGQLDAIGERLAALSAPVQRDRPAPEEGLRTIRADVAEMDELLDGLAEAHLELGALRRSLAVVERVRHTASLLSDQLSGPRARSFGAASDGSAVGQLRAMANDLGTAVASLERDFATGLDRIERELSSVRGAAERLRLLPARALFIGLERVARDAAQAVGKRVDFVGKGGDVRLDAHVLGTIQSALLQGVRNAVVHGIETESERLAAGKPPEGRITIEIVRRGNRVAFFCRDDGRGMDLEGIRRAAERKGLLPGALAALGTEDLLRLLLQGGISTSGTVTELSGRGVGLDVVREAVASLGGEVQARTREGEGTVLELVVPVSISSLPALVVEAAGVTAAIPLEAVKETLRVAAGDVVHGAQGESLVFEGKVIPFVALARTLGRRSANGPASQAWSAVVLDGGESHAAVGVDRLVGAESIVLRPLPGLAPASAVVAGAALDASGNPRVVLDPRALLAAAQRLQPEAAATPVVRPPILIIDDSLTTRMLEQSILESAGYEVDLAVSAEEALSKARRSRYGLFLVDIEMPGMDGFAFIEQIRADPGLRDTPAILVTSRAADEDRRRGEEAGADGYVVKSEFEQTELLQRIRRLMG